jgi:hypothetical protein
LFQRYGESYLQSLSVCQLIKYAAIALAYKRLSVAVYAMNMAFHNYGPLVKEIIDEHPEYQEAVYLRQYVNQNMERYRQDPYFFEKDEFIQKLYGPVENLTNRSLP